MTIAIARVALVLFTLAGAAAAESAPEAATVLRVTGVRGGLCLMIGAKAPGPAVSLARGSALYVQVLQPEWKMAQAWGPIRHTGCGK